ncbi:transglutaminase domain-containing protein [Streptomyces sp. NPDC051569]|uniref:transglutaminase domain-containing protein n=1 Tax=Streptomyces sp. NPDC051569 TaxID=3365661 RepID=UPI0037AFD951
MPEQDPGTLPYYTRPGIMTSAGRFAPLFDVLPRGVPALAGIAQGLLIHEHVAHAYGRTLSDEDHAAVHIRRVEELLERIAARDPRPLDTARPLPDRIPANCGHFSVLMVAMLRAQGTPARARCGFAGYLGAGTFEDHWVCEYWNSGERRWDLVDAQLDARQRMMFRIDFDPTRVPRDRYLTAGEAWRRCRAGTADPERFGLRLRKRAGLWWIAGNLMRDAAALGGVELLPWDAWGAMPRPHETIDDERAAFFDGLAALTGTPDTGFDALRRLGEEDARLRVPEKVYNALREREEAIPRTGEARAV